ncbi:MAG: MBL fold metallo-hydrolase [Opitutaceae bacterium]|nr:MBL fold metallo-hydrolase [Opitutaceae bacterium]
MIACDCAVCASPDPRDKRTRCSVHVVMDGLRAQVDAGPEFRVQCLRENIRWMDFFILTHGHADHVLGMDDLRRFCDLRGGNALTVYTTGEGIARVREIYPYTLNGRPAASGYAAFDLRKMPAKLELEQGRVESVLLPHGATQTLGLAFTERSSGRKFVYYTDCKSVPREALELARGADVVVLDGLRPEPHASHMAISEAVAVAREIGAPRTLLTHLTHLTGHEELRRVLPAGVEPAHDGLRVRV